MGMKLSLRDTARVAHAAQQQALIQLGGSPSAVWSGLTEAAKTVAMQAAALALAENAAEGATAAAFNAGVPASGLTVGSTPQTAAAAASNDSLIALKAVTLTGTINPGDTFVVNGVTYTAKAYATAAANQVVVPIVGKVGQGIAINTAFSAYTVVNTVAQKAQHVFDQVVLALTDSYGG